MDADERLARMVKRGRTLRALFSAFPCRLTFWLLKRQVDRLERALGSPPSHVAETFGRLHQKPEHPAARAHQARVEREAKLAESREVAKELERLFQSMREWG